MSFYISVGKMDCLLMLDNRGENYIPYLIFSSQQKLKFEKKSHKCWKGKLGKYSLYKIKLQSYPIRKIKFSNFTKSRLSTKMQFTKNKNKDNSSKI